MAPGTSTYTNKLSFLKQEDNKEPPQQSALQIESNAFKSLFNNWLKELLNTKVIVKKSENNFIICKSFKNNITNKQNIYYHTIPSIEELKNINLINIIESRHDLTGRINYQYYERETGDRIFTEDLVYFLNHNINKIYKNKEIDNKSKNIRVLTTIYNKESYNTISKQTEIIPGISFVDKSMKIEELNTFKDIQKEYNLYKVLSLVKIISCKESIELFGYKNLKNKMLDSGGLYKVNNIHFNFQCKKDDIFRNIIEVENENGKTYKFLLSEIELFLPNIEAINKWGKEPKERIIKVKENACLIKSKHSKIPHKSIVSINSLTKIGGNDYASVKFENKNYIINKKHLKVI